ncbi:WD40-repeat-containing domain protein [Zychaea mexicana]|uniref:WD40-repeat-containing domain protein n=1 Tax=Zychaea mexicana TaxID=64656 RepID=UPI0022FE59F9|nr:WD40-repeat-containing domain protein [Zychaea mexicana]KAI9494000.1 WD40-repeat-containing domain protein [Zychaea mexicana]
MDTAGARKKLRRADDDSSDIEEEKNANEKDLEAFLFGNADDEIWEQAGHELSDRESDQEKSETEKDDEEQAFFFDSGPGFVMDSDPMPVAEDETMKELDLDSAKRFEGDDEVDYEDDEDEDDESEPEEEKNYGYSRKPAWEDEDDARLMVSLMAADRLRKLRKDENEDVVNGLEYEKRLRTQHAKMHPRPEWATLPSDLKRKRGGDGSDDEHYEDDENQLDDEDRLDLLKSTYGVLQLRRENRVLPSNFLDIKRYKNANQMSPSEATISTVEFHPNAQVMMTASMDKTLRLFQVDGRVNPKIQSVRFQDLRLTCAAFHPSGDQIILSGKREFYYIYDVQSGSIDRCPRIWGRQERSLEKFSISPCGRYIAFKGDDGHIILVSALTKQWIGDLKMNQTVRSLDWSSDGKYLYSIGSDAEVYQWDVGERECVKRWRDDGGVDCTALGVSWNDKYYATGSSLGVVNLYDQRVLEPQNTQPKPYKTLGNLTTSISQIKFNHDSQLMAYSSSDVKNQLRVVHTATGSVFSNWPTERTPLNKVSALNFSPNSDYLAVGDMRGRVLLYGLNHYAL